MYPLQKRTTDRQDHKHIGLQIKCQWIEIVKDILSYLKPDNHRLLNRLELIIFQ